MISPEPYANRLIYLLQTKLQLELSHDMIHDINCALYDYARKSEKECESEKKYWQDKYLNK